MTSNSVISRDCQERQQRNNIKRMRGARAACKDLFFLLFNHARRLEEFSHGIFVEVSLAAILPFAQS